MERKATVTVVLADVDEVRAQLEAAGDHIRALEAVLSRLCEKERVVDDAIVARGALVADCGRWRCAYCNSDAYYFERVTHKQDCPIEAGRQLLEHGPNPGA